MSLVRPPTSCVVTYNNLRCILCLPHCEGTNNLSCSSNESNNFSFLIACHCTCHQSPFYWHVDSSVKQRILKPKGREPCVLATETATLDARDRYTISDEKLGTVLALLYTENFVKNVDQALKNAAICRLSSHGSLDFVYQGGPLLIVVPLWPVDGEIIRRIPLQFNPCTVGVPSSSFRNPNASCLLISAPQEGRFCYGLFDIPTCLIKNVLTAHTHDPSVVIKAFMRELLLGVPSGLASIFTIQPPKNGTVSEEEYLRCTLYQFALDHFCGSMKFQIPCPLYFQNSKHTAAVATLLAGLVKRL